MIQNPISIPEWSDIIGHLSLSKGYIGADKTNWRNILKENKKKLFQTGLY